MTRQRRTQTSASHELGRSRQDAFAGIEFDDDDLQYPDGDYVYNRIYGCWEPRPEWMHPECVDTLLAKGEGTCCKYPADALVSRALDLAEAADRTLSGFDRVTGDCEQTARELIRLLESVPGLVAEIRAALPAADRTVAAQLLCPLGRLMLLVLELTGASGCPLACTDHEVPDRRAVLMPLVPLLEECDEALWDAVLPRRRRTQR